MIGSYIKVSKPIGKDGDGERWAMEAKIMAVDCYNGAVSDTNQTLSSAANDKDHTGGVLVVMGYRLTSTTDVRSYTKEQEH